jgi:hypothetical protein
MKKIIASSPRFLVNELFGEFTQSGADIFHEPVDREFYGMHEIGKQQ